MSGVVFLLLFAVVAVVGIAFVWLRHRRPQHFMHSLDEFQREMDALGKPPVPSQPPRPVRPVTDNRKQGR